MAKYVRANENESKLENIPRHVTPTVMGCLPLLFYHTFLNLQRKYDISYDIRSKCGINFMYAVPETFKVLNQM